MNRIPPSRISLYLCSLFLAVIFSGCALLPTGSVSLENPFAAQEEEPTPTPIPTAIVAVKPTYEVQEGEIVREVSFHGRIAPVEEYELFFNTGGRVREIYAQRGEMVEEGQVIADLEIDDLERELTAAGLELERAQSLLADAEEEISFERREAEIALEIARLRLTGLRRENPEDLVGLSIQQKQVELAELALERLEDAVDPLLQNDVERAQLAVESLESAVANATLTAPINGQLLSLSLSVGRPVEAFTPVAVVADVENLEVSSDLTSSQLEELEEGMPVEVMLVGRPGETLTGTIRRLPYPYGSGGGANVEDLDQSTRIAVDQSAEEAGYALGDLVQVEAELERKDLVLWLPPQAIRVFDGRRFVVVQDEDVQRRVDVQTGIQTADRVEIVEGLEIGQVVVGQ